MSRVKLYLFSFFEDLKASLLDLSVIIGIIAIYQFAILRSVPDNLPAMVVGLLFVVLGLALFLRGLELGGFPLGEELSRHLARKKTRVWIVVFAFVIGFATTIAEPALITIAHKAAVISDGQINALTLRLVVALSVGFAIVIGVIRILVGHPIHYYIIVGYVLVIAMTAFAPEEIVGLAYDSGGITTSTVTVPLIAALGLYFFVIGLELGLFPVGETLAIDLAKTNSVGLIYSFAFAVGFATTVAEPALTAIARKAEEISDGSSARNCCESSWRRVWELESCWAPNASFMAARSYTT